MTRVQHKRHECNTTATRVRHKRHKHDTSATRVLHEQHECDASVKRHKFGQGHSKKLLWCFTSYFQTFKWKILKHPVYFLKAVEFCPNFHIHICAFFLAAAFSK